MRSSARGGGPPPYRDSLTTLPSVNATATQCNRFWGVCPTSHCLHDVPCAREGCVGARGPQVVIAPIGSRRLRDPDPTGLLINSNSINIVGRGAVKG